MNDTRTFGVELEFNTNGQGGSEFAKKVLTEAGLATWCKIHHDGSEVEIPSPVLKGDAGKEEVAAAMKALKDAGCKTNRSDGMHVHHAVKDIAEKLAVRTACIESWFNNQALIWKFVAPRRENSYVCYSVKKEHIAVGNIAEKYHALSFRPVQLKGTAELRLHEGTLDFKYAEAWFEFGQAFFEGVKENGAIKKADSAMDFLTQLPLDKKYVMAMCKRVDEYEAWLAKTPKGCGPDILVSSDFTGAKRKTTGSSGRFD